MFSILNKFTDKLISAVVNEFAAELKTCVVTTLKKTSTISAYGSLVNDLLPWRTYIWQSGLKNLDKWKWPLSLLNIFKIFFIHVYEQG